MGLQNQRPRDLVLFTVVLAALGAFIAPGCAAEKVVYDIEIVRSYPHDAQAYTQGLFFHDGFLYESTGLEGASSLRKVEIETGEVLQRTDLPADLFGEGVTLSKGRIVGLTWLSGTGFVYDLETLERTAEFAYPGEGWGLTDDGERLIMSDGTAELRRLDRDSLQELSRVPVTHAGKPVGLLNELEFIDGEVYANILGSDLIVRINPQSGKVASVIDLRMLRGELGADAANAEVLNGIAYDEETGRLFVTGKFWPKLFEIKLKARGQ